MDIKDSFMCFFSKELEQYAAHVFKLKTGKSSQIRSPWRNDVILIVSCQLILERDSSCDQLAGITHVKNLNAISSLYTITSVIMGQM